MSGPRTDLRTWCTERLELGEGARWVDGRLVLVDLLAGRLLQADGASPGELTELASVGCPLGAVAPVSGRPGTWLAAAGTGVALLDRQGGAEWLARPEEGGPVATRMNDGVAGPDGRFWAGSMAYDLTPGAGSLYRVDPDGTVTAVLDGLTIANGPAFSADGSTMYLADSGRGVIDRFRVDGGELRGRERFAEVPGASPDGMTVDAEGGLWAAIWGAGTVRRYRPDGTVDRDIRLPARQPASVCLGGPGGRRLFITTATIGLDPAGPADGRLYAIDVEVAGPPASAVRLS